jgi:hypothetical protein
VVTALHGFRLRCALISHLPTRALLKFTHPAHPIFVGSVTLIISDQEYTQNIYKINIENTQL